MLFSKSNHIQIVSLTFNLSTGAKKPENKLEGLFCEVNEVFLDVP